MPAPVSPGGRGVLTVGAALVLVLLTGVGVVAVHHGGSSDDRLSSTSLPLAVLAGWQQYEVRTNDGTISWMMPVAYDVDGPRSVKTVPPPATGTFWIQTSPAMPLRHEADLFAHVASGGSNDEAIGRAH